MSKDKWIKELPNLCPNCGTDDFEADIDFNLCDSISLVQRASCPNCEANWHIFWAVVGIEESKE